jgi:hypothetical protein
VLRRCMHEALAQCTGKYHTSIRLANLYGTPKLSSGHVNAQLWARRRPHVTPSAEQWIKRSRPAAPTHLMCTCDVRTHLCSQLVQRWHVVEDEVCGGGGGGHSRPAQGCRRGGRRGAGRRTTLRHPRTRQTVAGRGSDQLCNYVFCWHRCKRLHHSLPAFKRPLCEVHNNPSCTEIAKTLMRKVYHSPHP